MAKKKSAKKLYENPFLQEAPAFPTAKKKLMRDGRLVGTPGSGVWLYKRVPMSPVRDAKTLRDQLEASVPLAGAYRAVSELASVRRNVRRTMVKGNYRQTHLLFVNIPQWFSSPFDHPCGPQLDSDYGRSEAVDNRVLLFGVQLRGAVLSHGGIRGAIDSVIETFTTGDVPIEEYDEDFKRVDAALTRAGLISALPEHHRLAEAWFNYGLAADPPMLPGVDSLTVFSHPSTAEYAYHNLRQTPVADWPELPGYHHLSMASVQDLDLRYVASDTWKGAWGTQLVDSGAAMISIRGLVEPSSVTRKEVEAQQKRYTEDIQDRVKNNKLDKAEQHEMLAELESINALYGSDGAPATLVDASIIVGFGQYVPNIDEVLPEASPVSLVPMTNRQPAALAEAWPASNIRVNPHLHDLPITSIAYSGLVSLSRVGDAPKNGAALVGFTERDRQPSWWDPRSAYEADKAPIYLVAGASGSGKAHTLDTRVVTPTGFTTIGDLRPGDEVIGRDGKVCRVQAKSPVIETPELYRITTSDGQTNMVDGNHQWVVSSFQQRTYPRRDKRRAAIANQVRMRREAQQLEQLGARLAGSEMTCDELFEQIDTHTDIRRWKGPAGVYGSLRMMDAPYRQSPRTFDSSVPGGVITKTDPVTRWDARELIQANLNLWENLGGNPGGRRWAQDGKLKSAAAAQVLERVPAGAMLTVTEISRLFEGAGYEHNTRTFTNRIRQVAQDAGVTSEAGTAEVTIKYDKRMMTRNVHLYDAGTSLRLLAQRIHQMAGGGDLGIDPDESVLSTAEMLDQGLTTSSGASNFAIRLSAGLQSPHVDVPVDPYVLGAWLGDGSSRHGTMETMDAEIVNQIAAAGYPISSVWGGETASRTYTFVGLRAALARAMGGLGPGVKHIPALYLRSSFDQRLALLQGLMDTDGTIGETGSCELTFCHKPLADGALELIRSLGIKASMSEGPAAVTEEDPDNSGQTRRRVVGTRYRIHFTTNIQVFRLSRKACRVPVEVRETQKWLYITNIEPVDPEPAQCITVDSPDSTYLVEGFIPTHNSVFMLNVADQLARGGTATVIIDPKQDSDHSLAVNNSGGQTISLDSLLSADGVFDPLRFGMEPEMAVDLAAGMLQEVNPWGDNRANFEVASNVAIAYGVEHGARCTGEALQIALRDKQAPEEMVDPVIRLAQTNAQFRAMCGLDPQSDALRVAEGITYIRVGRANLSLPEPGAQNIGLTQRISLNLVRLMVSGSAMALTGRNGMVMLDEAWVFLGSGNSELERLARVARSQTVTVSLFTQRVSDATVAGIDEHIAGGFILPLKRAEAIAACEILQMEPTEARLGRITAEATIGGVGDGELQPNWNSMRALHKSGTREVIRGSVSLFADIHGRVVPVEIVIPASFLEKASTQHEDIARRQSEQRAAQEGATA